MKKALDRSAQAWRSAAEICTCGHARGLHGAKGSGSCAAMGSELNSYCTCVIFSPALAPAPKTAPASPPPPSGQDFIPGASAAACEGCGHDHALHSWAEGSGEVVCRHEACQNDTVCEIKPERLWPEVAPWIRRARQYEEEIAPLKSELRDARADQVARPSRATYLESARTQLKQGRIMSTLKDILDALEAEAE